jgi:hypothetical protein
MLRGITLSCRLGCALLGIETSKTNKDSALWTLPTIYRRLRILYPRSTLLEEGTSLKMSRADFTSHSK